MNDITCPNCEATVNVDHGRKAGRGQLRLACESCGHRFAVRVQKKDLRLEGDAENSNSKPRR
jgi:predicted Zn finger-like uncharacterized protein